MDTQRILQALFGLQLTVFGLLMVVAAPGSPAVGVILGAFGILVSLGSFSRRSGDA